MDSPIPRFGFDAHSGISGRALAGIASPPVRPAASSWSVPGCCAARWLARIHIRRAPKGEESALVSAATIRLHSISEVADRFQELLRLCEPTLARRSDL